MQNPAVGFTFCLERKHSKTGKPDRYFTYVAGEYYAYTDGTTLTLRIQGESNDPLPHSAELLNMGKFREQ